MAALKHQIEIRNSKGTFSGSVCSSMIGKERMHFHNRKMKRKVCSFMTGNRACYSIFGEGDAKLHFGGRVLTKSVCSSMVSPTSVKAALHTE